MFSTPSLKNIVQNSIHSYGQPNQLIFIIFHYPTLNALLWSNPLKYGLIAGPTSSYDY